MAHTYILYSPSLDAYYIGHTELDVASRLTAHLKDHSGFTAKAKDWKILFQQEFESKAEAYKFERQIKGWKSRRAIENLINGV
jgi:putative endonuclease